MDLTQALLLVLTKAGLERDSLARSGGGRVTWLGAGALGLLTMPYRGIPERVKARGGSAR